MKRACLFFVFLIAGLANINAQEKSAIAVIREELFYTDFDLEKCFQYYTKVEAFKQSTPVITAYEAAAKALIAKHSWNPISKISNLKEAMALLTKAVDLDKMNLEIRFLRLYIENSLPSYIGMKDNIVEDKKLIIENIQLLDSSDLNADIIQYILKYMSTEVACTSDEMQVIKARLI
ncbi:hypothetical protein [Fulvivirga lutimaris]|uniref:hypothetical protein n=1 Tax=Fulvivirga lutimaris TaxID=1819566 RepID=UPI0012BBA0D1|nr:hypothetical protein [Fulvivirga lutimaris]MTI38546.1 hypothetical protein [Fulvivirga lutimaris]